MLIAGITASRKVGGDAFSPAATDFDGTGDRYNTTSMTGASNSKTFACSFWINLDAITSTDRIWNQDDASPFIRSRIEVGSSGQIIVVFEDTSGNIDVNVTTANSKLTTSAGWQHVGISFNTVNGFSSGFVIYVDGVSAKPGSGTVNNDTIAHVVDNYTIGAFSSGGNDIDACISEFWLTYKEFVDFSNTTTREKFRNSSGEAVDLGSDGSTPTGTQPDVYCTGGEASFGTNLGSGSNFTKTGNPSDCADGPNG